PDYKPEEKECLATLISIGGCKAWTLWDSGSTTMGLTPMFAQVANIRVFPLTNPHVPQLGTVGSQATVNYGAEVKLEALGISDETYVDITNFDCYDMIIGTPFMHKNKVILDFKNKQVIEQNNMTMSRSTHSFWARLIPRPQHNWLHDPRMPDGWNTVFSDILGGTRDQLPPWREVNHEIHLIDDNKLYHYHLPKVPNSLHEQFHEKVNRYVNTGWWEPRSVNQAAPMFCLSK
ncbi:hypothetical protein L208DRAFT_1037025, partial [Tricholoma matsutake]